jgi:2'-5' RNA ligase
MTAKAVDIVLIPDKQTRQLAIDLNARLRRDCPENITLGHEHYLPHISLCMGVLDEGKTADFTAFLARTATEQKIGKLRINGMVCNETDSCKMMNLLSIRKTNPLQQLHEKIVSAGDQFLDNKPTKQVFADDKVSDSTLEWVSSYRQAASFERFFPHITLGYGRTEVKPFTTDFYPEKLALCHLGNHCTCKNIITAVDIS